MINYPLGSNLQTSCRKRLWSSLSRPACVHLKSAVTELVFPQDEMLETVCRVALWHSGPDWHVLITLCFQRTAPYLRSSNISTDSLTLARPAFSATFSPVAQSASDTYNNPSVWPFASFIMCYFSAPAVEVPDNLPFPDGKEVSPEIEVETLPGNCCHSNTFEIQLASISLYVKLSIRQSTSKKSL